ncbi:MAG: CvpA family protein [Anaerolineae bacterium]|nr:CvpA family protein [Anaerolineae bacterium]MDW8067582.1 CvpA family protein [Anaerolineae bacterium]
MIPLNTFFWLVVLLFGLIGALRGWVRELLVTLAIIAAYFLRWLFLNIIPFIREYLRERSPVDHFYIFSALFIILALSGYAGPVFSPFLAERARREKIQDLLLGFVFGAVNGYLLAGTIWGFMHFAGYNIWGILPPDPGSPAYQFATNFLPYVWMSDTLLLILTGVTLIVVLVVLL